MQMGAILTTRSRFTSVFLAFAVALTLVLAIPAFDTTADAATTVSKGRIVDYTYNAKTERGHLRVINSKGTTSYRVTKDTDCGVSYGQSGDSINCNSLDKEKYKGKPVRIRWTETGTGTRKAVQVAVDMSEPA
jgi:hypothetical protein